MRNGLYKLLKTAGLIGALVWAALPRPAAAVEQTICAVVNLELGQQAALEREGFTARLALTNNLGDLPLSNLGITVNIKDADGNAADHLFYTKITDMQSVSAIDGTGIVQPSAKAVIKWLIIPSAGAGGTGAAGKTYYASARMQYYTGGVPRVTTTLPASITVKPQPMLRLEYVLPFEVFGDDPLTPSIVESTEPFPLGLRVTNIGAGTARNFHVDSDQIEITANDQALVSSFSVIGSWLGSQGLGAKTLAIPFGDIAPGGVKQAAWSLYSSLSGRFTDFTASFVHSAELGGELTSLINGIDTYTLIKDVLVDLDGRDAQFDFLVNKTVPRAELEALYQQGGEPAPEYIMESDRAELLPVRNVEATLAGALSGGNSVLRLSYNEALPAGIWVHSSMPLSADAPALVSMVRSDGRAINPRNVWVAKHYDKLTHAVVRRLHILDYTGAAGADYAMTFNAAALDTPPAAIGDLALTSDDLLSWTATGEDGTSGAIYGGRYALYYSTGAAAPSVAGASVFIATSTPAGAVQAYALPPLMGNATYQFALFLADTNGAYSGVSNLVSKQTAILPPPGLEGVSASSSALTVTWLAADNNMPVEYSVSVSTVSGGTAAAPSPFKTPEDRFYSIGDITPNTTYLIYGVARNPDTGELSARNGLGSALTLAAQPGALISSAAYISSMTFAWDAGGNPAGTEFLAQISTTADWSAPLAAAWSSESGASFSGLSENTVYYARAKARNAAGAETAFVGLGVFKTASTDLVPPSIALFIGGQLVADSSAAYMSASDVVSITAADDVSGVGGIYYSIDTAISSGTALVYTVPFTVSKGTHTIYYSAVDNAGNWAEVMFADLNVYNSAVTCGSTLMESTLLKEDLDCSSVTGSVITIGADAITFDGSGHKIIAPSAARVIGGGGRRKIVIRNMDLSGTGVGNGIEMSTVKDSIVENVTVHGRVYGVIFRYTNDNLIVRGNDLSANWVGLEVAGSSATVSSNKLGGNGFGVSYVNASSMTLLADNDFSGSTTAITMLWASGIVFDGLTLNNPKAIVVDTSNNLVFRNLDLSGSGGMGMDASKSKDCLIENVTAHGRDIGVRFYNYAGGSTFRDNDFSGNRIGLMVGGSTMTVTGNKLSNNSSGTGLAIDAGWNDVVEGNTAENNQTGISFYGSGSVVRGNILGNNQTALAIVGSSVTVSSNVLSNSETGLNAERVFGLDLASDNDFSASTTAIWFANGGNAVFENMRLDNRNPIKGGGNYNLVFRDLDLSGTGVGNGIEMSTVKDSIVENVTVHGRVYGVIFRYDSAGITIKTNDLRRNSVGINISGGGMTISGNQLGENDRSIEVINGSSITLASDNAFAGSGLAVSAYNIADTIIDGLTADTTNGISIEYSRNILLRNLNLRWTGVPRLGMGYPWADLLMSALKVWWQLVGILE